MARLFSTKVSQLPKARPGDAAFCTDTKQVFIAVADSSWLDLADLLSGAVPHVRQVGPQGERGDPGSKGDRGDRGERGEHGTPGKQGDTGSKGERGSDGLHGQTGKPGKDGKDSFVPGPCGGKGDKGDRGEPGPRGDVLIVGESELASAVKALRNELLQQRAKVLAALAQELEDSNTYPPGAERLCRMALESVQRKIQ